MASLAVVRAMAATFGASRRKIAPIARRATHGDHDPDAHPPQRMEPGRRYSEQDQMTCFHVGYSSMGFNAGFQTHGTARVAGRVVS